MASEGPGILIRLFQLAFRSRFAIPLLISAGFMVLDGYQVTIELEVEGNVRHNHHQQQQEGNNNQQWDFALHLEF